MRRNTSTLILVAVCLAMLPATATAQSAIAGAVKDTTGAVLPGVTVEAASSALIEKVRTVVTDDQGQYKIIDLRPGVYAVTFTLTGFNTAKREGIALSASFTATVNAEMRVGSLEETVTVSGQSPVVDVQNVVQRHVITSDVFDALPTGRTNQMIAATLPGLVVAPVNRPTGQDVGGLSGEGQYLATHGGRVQDFTIYLDGIPYNALNAAGATSGYRLNAGEVQEFTYELGAISVENTTGGIRSNVIPKEGGNLFKGTIFANFANENLQNDNVTDSLRARGLRAGNRTKIIWDVNPSFGGPIKRDRLWFFGSYRYWGLQEWVAGMWYDKDPYDFVYTPDLSRQAIDDSWNTSEGLRLTWQATPKNKIAIFLLDQHRCQCNYTISATKTPEAAGIQRNPLLHAGQASWRSPVTNRLLLEAGVLIFRHDNNYGPHKGAPWELGIAAQELSTGVQFRARPTNTRNLPGTDNYRASLTYVTGSHAFKFGLQLQRGTRLNQTSVNGDMNFQLLNGVPRAVIVYATPYDTTEKLNAALGLFAQDQWTIRRLTLNAGVRVDHHNESVPAQHEPAGRFAPARDFAEVPDVPNWNDVSPRLGASYDLFGTGKTALKVTLSRYVAAETIDVASANNPVNTTVNSATRTWTDLNGDFVPQENELGPLSNANFGKVVIRSRYDDDLRTGFGKRNYNWETSASVQHELTPQVSVNASYFRRSYGNFTATDNILVSPADYDPFCITSPVDARLPGGGQPICGLYDISPAKFGQVNNLVTFAKNFGTQYEHWNGTDLSVSTRLPHHVMLSGGLATGKTVFDNCDVMGKVDNPGSQVSNASPTWTAVSPSRLYCHQETPFLTQVKANGIVDLPWSMQASGTFQSIPGPQITARYVATSAEIRPSLGRNLSSGANGTQAVELIAPGTMYAERMNQADMRVAKIVPVGRTRIKGIVDVYNVFNASPVLVLNTTYGPAWQQPSYILPARLFKLGVQIDF